MTWDDRCGDSQKQIGLALVSISLDFKFILCLFRHTNMMKRGDIVPAPHGFIARIKR